MTRGLLADRLLLQQLAQSIGRHQERPLAEVEALGIEPAETVQGREALQLHEAFHPVADGGEHVRREGRVLARIRMDVGAMDEGVGRLAAVAKRPIARGGEARGRHRLAEMPADEAAGAADDDVSHGCSPPVAAPARRWSVPYWRSR